MAWSFYRSPRCLPAAPPPAVTTGARVLCEGTVRLWSATCWSCLRIFTTCGAPEPRSMQLEQPNSPFLALAITDTCAG